MACKDCPIKGTEYCHKVNPMAKKYTRAEKKMTNNPCIYCNGKVGDGKILCGDPEDIGEVTNIVKTDDGFKIEHWGGFAYIASVEINFCPMCGRKLAEAKK